jgi:hypothetical protein
MNSQKIYILKEETMNMKRGILLLALLLVFCINDVSADRACSISADLINQDPHPALAGGYVEVLFQLTGTGSCDDGAIAHLVLDYPFSLDEGDSVRVIKSSTYAGYGQNSNWNLLYKIRVDPDAIEGDYEVELRYKGKGELNPDSFVFEKFTLTVEDGLTDFEIYVNDHNIKDRNLVFEILNNGNQDIEALTIEIPKQDNIIVKGSNRNIVGDLDSNEFTTADFEAIPSDGDINLVLYYTDSTNERRMMEKTVSYDSSYFIGSIDNTAPSQMGTYVTVLIVILLIGFFVYRKKRKNKNKKKNKFNI